MRLGRTEAILILFLLACGLMGCSQVGFNPTSLSGATAASSTSGSTCNNNLGTTKIPTKMIFVVDMSGSNQSAPGCSVSSTCTDPGKAIRGGSIQKFLNDYGSHTNFGWAFDVFFGTSSTALTGDGSSTAPIFVNAAAMQSSINTFMGMTDQGDTPYLAALANVQATIANDPDLNSSSNPQYVVVFMSDGQPDADESLSNILSAVSGIVALAPKRVTFNSIYYGTSDPIASSNLQQMATTGNGNFLDTNSNPTGLDFSIGDLITLPCP